MKRKVLILGGGGFIGSAIARILSKRENYIITIADNFHHNQDDEIFMNFISDNDIKLLKADFTEKSSFDLLEDKYDDFYMLASMIGVNNTLENPHEIIRVNTALIYNSLEWVKNNSVKMFYLHQQVNVILAQLTNLDIKFQQLRYSIVCRSYRPFKVYLCCY